MRLEKNNGYLFSDYVTPVAEDNTQYKVYLSELKDYWEEKYGQQSWEDADFEEIDNEVQSSNPELFYCDKGSDDNGEYLLYTTDESNAR